MPSTDLEALSFISDNISTVRKFWVSRKLNPGWLGEKRKRYLCAMPTPTHKKFFHIDKKWKSPKENSNLRCRRIFDPAVGRCWAIGCLSSSPPSGTWSRMRTFRAGCRPTSASPGTPLGCRQLCWPAGAAVRDNKELQRRASISFHKMDGPRLWHRGRLVIKRSRVSNPVGCRAFFLLLLSVPTFLHQWSVLNQVPQRSTVCCESHKNGCLAVLLWAQ